MGLGLPTIASLWRRIASGSATGLGNVRIARVPEPLSMRESLLATEAEARADSGLRSRLAPAFLSAPALALADFETLTVGFGTWTSTLVFAAALRGRRLGADPRLGVWR